MLTTTLQTMQIAGTAGVTRALASGIAASATASQAIRLGSACVYGTGSIFGTAWLAITRKPMTVNAFHDRWPLCST